MDRQDCFSNSKLSNIAEKNPSYKRAGKRYWIISLNQTAETGAESMGKIRPQSSQKAETSQQKKQKLMQAA
jgi:hypothetical protein